MKFLNEKSLKALENLKTHRPQEDRFDVSERFAVLIALVANSEGDLEVIITSRSSKLRVHGGDSAFPGGKRDPVDMNLIATARREALEEIGLHPSASETLNILTPVISLNGLMVTPVIAFCPDMTTLDLISLFPNPGEVDAVFSAPLESFLSPAAGTHKHHDTNWLQSTFRVHYFKGCGAHNYILADEAKHRIQSGWTVYGFTAGLLIEVASIAFRRSTDFAHLAPGQGFDLKDMAAWHTKTCGAAIRASL
ncbi:hypothetical protein BGZ65_000839 [Modicella reniformis]|uniref:Nudix hydrolase domain-containing protein n=1 Tax=Modicella reniformis TaxID=1440133 RepID=A0A9P6M163_9FUNG|nr:hypothetical protein BGZ65_000839 [Modicella reniformis]